MGTHPHPRIGAEWRRNLALAGACGIAGIAAAVAERLGAPRAAALALWGVAYVAGSWEAAGEVWERVRKLRLDIHFLMLLVAFGSAALGEFAEGAILLFLFSLSGALEEFAQARTESEIAALLDVAPTEATVLDADGTERRVPADSIATGMVLKLRPGDRVAADARVREGTTLVDESMLTGESLPRRATAGTELSAGSVLVDGAVEATVLRPPAESTLQRLVSLVTEARAQRSPSQRLLERFGTPYTWSILGACGAYFGGMVLWGMEPAVAVRRAMTLLVVASPCALALSIPSALLAAIAAGARRGVLFRNGTVVEDAALVDTIVFDKTGTLTTGRLHLEHIEVAGEWSADEALATIAGAEHHSTHPLARSIVAAAETRGIALPEAFEFRNSAGDGISARVGAMHLHVGRRRWLRELSDGRFPAIWEAIGHDDDRVRTYAWSERGSALLSFRDEPRAEAAATLGRLRAAGHRLVMLSGDAEGPVRALAAELGIAEWHARARPEDKMRFLNGLAAEGRQVAMVGDGVNDAAALAAARVGVVLGGLSSDAAAEEAGLVLVGGRLDGLLRALDLARRARGVMRANLAISIGAMAVLAVAAVAGALPLPAAVIGHEGSTVLVVLNSLRLLLARERREATSATSPATNLPRSRGEHGGNAESAG